MIVNSYLKMWPREALDLRNSNGQRLEHIEKVWEHLNHPGVYVLYRDDQPYYIGRAIDLNARIYAHAIHPKDPYYNFWNYFSAFLVPTRHIPEVEGILIAAFPTQNAATPKFKKLSLPAKVLSLLHRRRLIIIPDEG